MQLPGWHLLGTPKTQLTAQGGCAVWCAGEAEFSDKPALEVCYLRHAFGLGEHYNSTKKLLFGAAAMAEEEEEEESSEAEAGGGEAL